MERKLFLRNFLVHIFQIGSGAHPASYQIDIGGSFLGGKAAWSFTLIPK
jgi:hypothetical protein